MLRPRRRAIVAAFTAGVVALGLAAVPDAAAADPAPAPALAPFSCDVDNDGVPDSRAQFDAILAAELGAGHTVADFDRVWSARLRGREEIAGMDLSAYLVRDSLPAAIAAEGYHGLPKQAKLCLASSLYDHLLAIGDPGFPPPGVSADAAKGLLFGLVFDNKWIKDAEQDAGPAEAPEAQEQVRDAVDAVLAALRFPDAPSSRSATIAPNLQPVPLVAQSSAELQAGLTSTVGRMFFNLGVSVNSIGLGLTPIFQLLLTQIANLINLVRRVIDAATYRVCFTGGKWGTEVRCGPLAQPKGTDLPLPLGTVVPVDVAGDKRPDFTAQLGPVAGNGVGYLWRLSRNSNALTGVSGPIPAHVFAVFTLPTPDLQLSVGSDGTASTLAGISRYRFTLTDVAKAAQGDVNLAVHIVHNDPGAKSGISFGVSPLTRDPSKPGTVSSTTFDTGTLNFSPVPASTLCCLPNQGSENAIDAAIELKTADLDGDGSTDSRAAIGLTMPQPGITLDARILSKQAPATATAPCCPFREITSTVNSVPTSVQVNVDSFPSKRITDATYDANATIGQVDVAVKQFAHGTGDFPTGTDANNFTQVSALLKQIPTHVHVRYTAPDPATDSKTTVVHYDANAGIPHAEFASEEWADDPASHLAALQRRLSFAADSIPSVIDLTNTTTDVSDRNTTGAVSYQANGNVTNVVLDSVDVIGVTELLANAASLPKAIEATYDTETAAVDPLTHKVTDPGHTVVHVDGRTATAAAGGSESFGELNVRLRSHVSDFLIPDPVIAPEQHLLVNMDEHDADDPTDDTTQLDLRYSGLRALDASVLENGTVSATIRNDAEKLFIAQVNKPDMRISARIDKLPKQVTFSRTLVGGVPTHQLISYDGCTPTGSTCTPKKIDTLSVRVEGVVPAASVPAGETPPAFLAGEFADATVTDVPSHVSVDLDMPKTGKQQLTYDGAQTTGGITAALHKNVNDLGPVDLAAEVTTVPAHLDASWGEALPITFSSGAGAAIGRISAAVTNTGTAHVPATFAPHAAATYLETPGADPTLDASLGINNLASFSFDSGAGGGNFTGTLHTTNFGSNPSFTLTANARTLDAANPTNLHKATVIKTGPGGAVLDPLPSDIVISKSGDSITIDTTGTPGHSAMSGDVALGGPDGVSDALAESLPAVQGVHLGDGHGTGEADAIRMVLFLPALPTKAVIRYGLIKLDGPMPANPQPAFDISGFGTLPGNKLNIQLDLDDAAALDKRMHATIGMGGIAPALGFLKFFPIALNPNDAGDLDLEVQSKSGADAGALDLDLRLGEDGTAGAARPDSRVVVHTDVMPAGVLFAAKLGEAVAPDLANFHAVFRNAAGGLTGTPGHATLQYQTPGPDGVDLDDNPASKVSLDLKDVPSLVDFTVQTAASTKSGNPNETCGLKESDFVLPTIVYTSGGTNENSLDASVGLDLSFIEPGSPTITLELVDLANGFTITNTDEGGTFNIGNAGGTTGKVLVKIDPFDVTLLDLDWTGCPDSDDLISWSSGGRATVAIKPDNLRLEINGLQQVELKPGFSTGVSGSFTTLSLDLPNPTFTVTFADNFHGGIKIHLSDDVEGVIDVFSAPNGTVSFPLPVVFHIAEQTSGPWIDIFTGIPCVIPPFFVHAIANIKPHRVALSLNGFTVTGGTWTVTADPFGVSAGISFLFGGLDLIDTIAGLFTSPYDHGLQSPSAECELF